MPSDDDRELMQLLASSPLPPCAALTPATLVELEGARGFVRYDFPAQPAFENHFGNVQGGFAAAYVDLLVSVAAFARTRQWCPSVDFKLSFVAPWKLGPSHGEGLVVRAGRRLVFTEAKIWGPDGELVVSASATSLVPSG